MIIMKIEFAYDRNSYSLRVILCSAGTQALTHTMHIQAYIVCYAQMHIEQPFRNFAHSSCCY